MPEGKKLRIAATADLHYGKHSRGAFHDAFVEISRDADVLLLCGDLTDYGLAEEAEELVADIRSAVRIPVLALVALGMAEVASSYPTAGGLYYWAAKLAPESGRDPAKWSWFGVSWTPLVFRCSMAPLSKSKASVLPAFVDSEEGSADAC